MTATYATGNLATEYLKEQLRLQILGNSLEIVPDRMHLIQTQLSKRDRLAALLEGELNFHGENSTYASHDLHAFAAKFPPQLPRAFIRGLTNPGDVVLDPMMGSGTAVVEALLAGRRAIGYDIDPLAVRLCRVKTTPIDVDTVVQAGLRVMAQANALLAEAEYLDKTLSDRFDRESKTFIDYWFLPATQREIMSLVLAIESLPQGLEREFLELTLSSIIVTKSGGVSLARDLAHSRPHLDKTKTPRNALVQFNARLRKNISSIAELHTNGTHAIVQSGDARRLPLVDKTVDLVVTSPPYANAIDYMRAHKFSLVWFGKPISELSELRADYIGSERVGSSPATVLPVRPESIIARLAELDTKKAAVLRKYFCEMAQVIKEMHRVLRPDCAAVIVVGSSVMRGIDVQTHLCLADIGAHVGFDVVGVAERKLDRNKRMMPARFGRKSDSMIEQRMHEEYVIGFLKRSKT